MEKAMIHKKELKQFIEERKNEMITIKELQEVCIQMGNNMSAEVVIDFIKKSRFLISNCSKRAFRQLLFTIDSLFTFRRVSFCDVEFLLKMDEVKEKIKQYFTPNELIFVFEQKRILLLLLDENLITVDSLIEEVCSGESFFFYFFPEIKERNFEEFSSKIHGKFSHLLPLPDVTKHDELRRINENENEITKFIRNNDVEKFREYISLSNKDVNDFISYSMYDRNDFVNNSDIRPRLIEYAAFYSSNDIFRFLVSNGAEITLNLIQYAIAGGNIEIIQFLEERKIEIDENALRVAVQFHRNDIVEYLRDNYGKSFTISILQQSILAFNYEYFFELLELFKYDLNEKINGDPLIIDAVNRGYSEIIEILSVYPESLDENSYSIDFDLSDFDGFTALQMAILNDRLDLVEYILQFPNNTNNLSRSFAFSASRFKREEILNILIKIPEINVNMYYPKYGVNPLLCAIMNNDVDVIKILVCDERVNLNAIFLTSDNYGDTGLIYSIANNYSEIAKLLLNSNRVDINQADQKGNTALHVAIKHQNLDIVKFLLKQSTLNKSIKNKRKLTAYKLAVKNNFPQNILNQLK